VKMIIVGDFADPLSYLASQRVAHITALGLADVEWLAVEGDRQRPMSGWVLDESTLRAVKELRLPDEVVPVAGIKVPNIRAATSAYAESVSDGIADEIRCALFDALWVARRRVDDPDVIRSIVSAVLTRDPLDDIDERIRANQPLVPLGDPDALATSRRLGFIVSMGRGPLTLVGQRRIDAWLALWHRHGDPQLPLLITDDGEKRSGADALLWLAGLLPHQATLDRVCRPSVSPARTVERAAVSI
jgi:hypothetical protein